MKALNLGIFVVFQGRLHILLWTVVWVSHHEKFGEMINTTMQLFMPPWVLFVVAFSSLAYYMVQLRKAHDANGTLFLSWAIALSFIKSNRKTTSL